MELSLLVVSAADVGTEMVKAGLDEALVPYTEVDLNDPARPRIDDAFLVDRSDPTVRRARFQAVVLPSADPPGLSEAERAALVAFEREFAIRQLDAYVYPSLAVGLHTPGRVGYAGPFDGMTGSLTEAAIAGGFSYLNGSVPFEDLDPDVRENYGYVTVPLPADPERRRSFTPFLQLPIPGSGGAQGTVLGVFHDDGREEMVLMAAMNVHQLAQQVLFPGILAWLTRGVHLGTERNFLAIHVDDVFLPDARWDCHHNCTAGADCHPDVPVRDIVMEPSDVDFLLDWQRRQGIKLDMVFNAFGHDQALALIGSSALADALLAHKHELRWISHTYSHQYLGCVQDFSVVPWRCATDSAGRIRWTPYEVIYEELRENIAFGRRLGLPFDPTELVTGEHSGLRRAPVEPSDNPNLGRALTDLGIAWIGSDNSREEEQRQVGAALTVPRYPLNIFYNAGTNVELVDEYNWVYTPVSHGGSGICETDPRSTCIEPLDVTTSFFDYLVPEQARQVLLHILANSPRPHYVHQSNLTEDRILYPVLDRALGDYRRLFTDRMPLVNATTAEFGREFRDRAEWRRVRERVRAYVQEGVLVVEASEPARVPLMAPDGSLGPEFSRYGELRTGWQSVRPGAPVRLRLPPSVAYAH